MVQPVCTACGHANREGARFCDNCGAPLQAPALLPDRFVPSGAHLPGERKQVTVLFVDVQGSMRLAEFVDPEVWRAVLARFLGLVTEAVHRYEGTVNKFTGDGAMALFGAPVAQEDHAARACHAALRLRDALAGFANDLRREQGLNFQVRTGLNSGEVIAGGVGAEGGLDYTAIGRTVGLAQRMEALAEPGRPYLTEHTEQLVRGLFELEDLGRFEVRGAQEAVRAYALLGPGRARTRLQHVAAAGGLSRFVGREAEMADLERALERAAEGGHVVAIEGGAGVGKSRLCHEFAERCRARGVQVTEGRGLAHGRNVPLLPVIEIMRRWFGIADDDDALEARVKIAGRLLLRDETMSDALPLVFDLLGVPDPERPVPPMDGEARQRRLLQTVERLVASGAEPAVVLVEDLHWLDPGSESFLESLAAAVRGTRTLLLVNFRPDYDGAWMRRCSVERLHLAPLPAPAVDALVGDLLGAHPSLDGLAGLVAERTGGNPFFVEELVHRLVETGSLSGRRGDYRLVRPVGELQIPPTVHAVLAARIDRLPEREKAVLHAAAVVGRTFAAPVLRRVTGLPEPELDAVLAALCAGEFIRRGDDAWAFRHPLTEEVAYATQLRGRRAEVHAAVAAALEELHPDRLDELAALVAHHRAHAGQPLEAARWSARAATWAGHHHPAEALSHWRRVRELAGDVIPAVEEADRLTVGAGVWILELGWRIGLGEEEMEGVFQATVELAERRGWEQSVADVLVAYATVVGNKGDLERALELATEGSGRAEAAGETDLAAVAPQVYWLELLGRPREALTVLEHVEELHAGDLARGRQYVGFHPGLWRMFFRAGTLLWDLGRFAGMEEGLRRAVALARELDDTECLGWALSCFPNVALARAEPVGEVVHAREGLEIAERLGSSFSRQTAWLCLALAYRAVEDWSRSLDAAEQAGTIMRDTGTGLQYEPDVLSVSALARLGLGHLRAARETAEQAVASAERLHRRRSEAQAWWTLARVHVAAGAPARAAEAARRGAACLPEGDDALRPHFELVHADVAALQGDEAGERERLEAALATFRRQDAPGWVRRVEERLAAIAARV